MTKVIISDYYALLNVNYLATNAQIQNRFANRLAEGQSNPLIEQAYKVLSHSKLKQTYKELYDACVQLTLSHNNLFEIELPYEQAIVEDKKFYYVLKPQFRDFFTDLENVQRYKSFLVSLYSFANDLNNFISPEFSNIANQIPLMANLINEHFGLPPIYTGVGRSAYKLVDTIAANTPLFKKEQNSPSEDLYQDHFSSYLLTYH